MKKMYLDNAATTQIAPEVIDRITTSMSLVYGNPSSIHQIGRSAKAIVETARKNIAAYFNVTSSEIFFTAGGSEADNLILRNAVTNLEVQTIISSPIEHHAVLHSIEHLKNEFDIETKHVQLDSQGTVDLDHLELLLKEATGKTLVSLMYVNNEIGNLLDLQAVCEICSRYNALFHSDTVPGIGHFKMDMQQTPIDFMVASAHKFHGPKGVGFAYFKKGFGIEPILHGGEQERGARAGTENVHGILGMETALELAYKNLEKDKTYIQSLKSYFIEELKKNIPEVQFNGASESPEKSSYIVLNVRFSKDYQMLLFNLDMKGIAVSGGSACQSGSSKGSHVLNAILSEEDAKKTSVRFSFSKYNTREEIDYTVKTLVKILK